MSAFQKVERGKIQNQFPARSQNAMRFVRGQGVIDAGIAPDVERENDVELIGGERQLMDAGLEQTRARVSIAAEFDRAFAFVDARQLSLRKFPPERGEHSAAAATGIEDGKSCRVRFDGIGDVPAERPVPPIMVLTPA